VKFFPGYLLPRQPLLFTIKGKMVDQTKMTTTGLTLLKDGKGIQGKTLWDAPTHSFLNVDIVDQIYVYHQRVGIVMNGCP